MLHIIWQMRVWHHRFASQFFLVVLNHLGLGNHRAEGENFLTPPKNRPNLQTVERFSIPRDRFPTLSDEEVVPSSPRCLPPSRPVSRSGRPYPRRVVVSDHSEAALLASTLRMEGVPDVIRLLDRGLGGLY